MIDYLSNALDGQFASTCIFLCQNDLLYSVAGGEIPFMNLFDPKKDVSFCLCSFYCVSTHTVLFTICVLRCFSRLNIYDFLLQIGERWNKTLCETCSCEASLNVTCVRKNCPSCSSVSASYIEPHIVTSSCVPIYVYIDFLNLL